MHLLQETEKGHWGVKSGQHVGHTATNNSVHRRTAAKGRSCLPESRCTRFQFSLLREWNRVWLRVRRPEPHMICTLTSHSLALWPSASGTCVICLGLLISK